METYYIDPSAGGGGDGSIGSPFNTWASVTWAAGNSYLQKRGTTFNGTVAVGASGTAGNEITIGAYDSGADPIINATVNQCIIAFGKHHVNISDIDLTASAGVTALHLGTSYNINVSRVSITGGSTGIYLSRTNNLVIDNCSVTGTSTGLSIISESSVIAHDVTVKNSAITSCTGNGILIQYGGTAATDLRMYNITIENCDILNNGVVGIHSYCTLASTVAPNFWSVGGDDEEWHSIRNLIIRNNRVTGNGSTGIAARNIKGGSIISGNYVYDNCDNSTPGGIWTAACYDLLIEDNQSIFNHTNDTFDGCGIFLDHFSVRTICRRNYCADHDGSTGPSSGNGINVLNAQDCEIYSNICPGNRSGIWFKHASTSGCEVYNNTFYDNSVSSIYFDTTIAASTVTLKNNISYVNAGHHIYRNGTNAIISDYNSFYPEGSNKFYWNASNAADLAAWQTATSQDSNSITTNPLFVDAANDNFELSSKSSCSAAGVSIKINLQRLKDFNGEWHHPRSDIGAIRKQRPSGVRRLSRRRF